MRNKLASWRIREYNLFLEIFRFHNSKKVDMNFAKYIVAHILAKFKYSICNSSGNNLQLFSEIIR